MKAVKRHITYSKTCHQAWPVDAYASILSVIQKLSWRYKYVRFGITSDVKAQYDISFKQDSIVWQKMYVRYRTADVRNIKLFIKSCANDNHYIANNIHFPETLFDQPCTYYVYILVGKRKKGRNNLKKRQYTFVELFAGLGGFHTALTSLQASIDCRCVFAYEEKEELRRLYALNHTVNGEISGDLSCLQQIPHHDILCASLSEDKATYNTIFQVIRTQGKDKPRFLLLEAPANINNVDEWYTWNIISEGLTELGYDVKAEILSPHLFGLPQHRLRAYIVGIRTDMRDFSSFSFPEPTNEPCDIQSVINTEADNIQPLSLKQHAVLKAWQQFLDDCIEHKVTIPRFPVWATEFTDSGNTDTIANRRDPIPQWKRYCISKNRQFYYSNKKWLRQWVEHFPTSESSFLKMEWNVGEGNNYCLKDNIIQFLASGIRVKTPTYSPSLIGSLRPIIPWVKLPETAVPEYTDEELNHYSLTHEDISYGRYITIQESAKLQGLDALNFADLSTAHIYEALGTAVNSQMIAKIAYNLLVLY